MRTAIFDLDGTLCNIEHRLHHVRDGVRNWDAFFEGIPDDTVNQPVREILMALMASGNEIILCTGRPEKCRLKTVEWLNNNIVPFTALYMRPDNDTRPDHVVKAQILDGIKQDGFDPFVVIDDRQSVVDMWREQGLTCLQCAPPEPAVQTTASLTLMVGPSCAGTRLRRE